MVTSNSCEQRVSTNESLQITKKKPVFENLYQEYWTKRGKSREREENAENESLALAEKCKMNDKSSKISLQKAIKDIKSVMDLFIDDQK
jgi:hypothetical protein